MTATATKKKPTGKKLEVIPTCSFRECDRPATTRGLCHAHAMQSYRSGKLRPLRERRNEPSVKLPGMTISQTAAIALHRKGPTPYVAARNVIEEWAQAHND